MRAAAALFLALAGLAASDAQDAEGLLPESNSERLERLTGEIGEAKTRERELSREARELADEIDTLRRKAATAAASAQRKEEELTRLESEKAELERRVFEVRADLDRQNARLTRIIAVLQRMSADPPPALIVEPQDATAAARSAMLLSAIMPHLEKEARALTASLTELSNLRAGIADRTAALTQETAALAALRTEIDQTVTALAEKRTQSEAALEAERSRLRELGSESKDVAALIRRLEQERPKTRLDPDDPNAPVVVLSDAARSGAASALSLKGSWLWPASGEVVSPFGVDAEGGGHTKGLILDTRSGGQVVAPVDGRIDFADVYRGYGKLLIMSVGDGYHVLLAGLARVDTVVGQWVIAGEPVGVMGRTPGAAGDVEQGGRAELYVEIQRNGVPVDPAPWFASRGKVSG